MLFCVIVGEESGEDCSASVEWCRFVAARAKSRPLEWRGSTFAGDPNEVLLSSCGDKGTLLAKGGV